MYQWVEHTSELELEIEAATEPAVFLEALGAFAELVADEQSTDSEQRELEVRGDDANRCSSRGSKSSCSSPRRNGSCPSG
jgi:hypothetical protein